jgi:ATP synthase protein I
LGHGIDAALVTAFFVGIGFGLDRWLGTTPWFMIGLFLLGSIGVFAKFWYQYDARMNELDAERRQRVAAGRHAP